MHQQSTAMRGRVVRDIVDGNGLYFSRFATAGPYVFVGSTAVDSSGKLAAEADVEAPYRLSPPAHATRQAEYIYDLYRERLPELGSSLDDFLQLEQYIPRKVYADGYIGVRSRYLDRDRPTTALSATGELLPEGCVLAHTGIALAPDEQHAKEILGSAEGGTDWTGIREEFSEQPPYSEVVAAGPYVFVVGDVAMDPVTQDVEAAVAVPQWIWLGSEVRNEAEFLLTRLEEYLGRAGATLADIVHTTVYLTDIGDLFELDRVWRQRFPDAPPARTVVPVRGVGAPRFEGESLGHGDRAVKMEQLPQAIRPGFGATKEIVGSVEDAVAYESPAVKAGQLLWISQQYAGGRRGLEPAEDTRTQLDDVFRRLDELCRAGGTSLDNMVRLRAFVTDPADAYRVYESLKDAVPADPPTVAVTAVPGPLPVPGATVAVDAVVYVPE
ncbi:MAG: hypothetical protein QOE69_1309 [Thermoleophilaceae bacterium]|nr:hypothetical protein [Thermoleophilaceae bacterium]